MLNKYTIALFGVLSVMGALFYSHARVYRAGYDKATLEQSLADNGATQKRIIIEKEISKLTDADLRKRLDRWLRED